MSDRRAFVLCRAALAGAVAVAAVAVSGSASAGSHGYVAFSFGFPSYYYAPYPYYAPAYAYPAYAYPPGYYDYDGGYGGQVTYQPPPAQAEDQGYCREFQSVIVVDGRQEHAFGTACLQPDGSWQIVNGPR